MMLSTLERHQKAWMFFLALLLLSLFPAGCSKSSKHHELGAEDPNRRIDGKVAFDMPESRYQNPPTAVKSDAEQETEVLTETPGCAYPLVLTMQTGQTQDFSALVDSYRVFGWAAGGLDEGGVHTCESYVRLKEVLNCKNETVAFGKQATQLKGVFVVNVDGTDRFFKADLAVTENRFPVAVLFRIHRAVAIEVSASGGTLEQPYKLLFSQMSGPEFVLPASSFVVRVLNLLDPERTFGDLIGMAALSTSKRDQASAQSSGRFQVQPPSLAPCPVTF